MALLIAALLAAASGASSSAPAGASFDCARARAGVETRICANPDLAARDRELAGLYRRAREASPDPAALRIFQQNWLASRNACRDDPCLSHHYGERIALLADYVDALAAPGRPPADFLPRDEAARRCPRIVLPEAPNVEPDCRVIDWQGLGRIGPHARGWALYRVNWTWNGQERLQHMAAFWTHDLRDSAVLRLDHLESAQPGLAREIDDPAALRPRVAGTMLTMTVPGLDGRPRILGYSAGADSIRPADR